MWAGLPDAPWFGTVPTLTAAAMVTERIRLGTLVSSPNYRHPVTFLRDLLALDDISGGRILCGLGTGGDLDSRILAARRTPCGSGSTGFHEFTALLDRLLREDHVDHEGTYYRAVDARTLPGPVQRPRIPFVIAANGPRSLRLAAEHGAGWVTTGGRGRHARGVVVLGGRAGGAGSTTRWRRQGRDGARRATATSSSTPRRCSRCAAWTLFEEMAGRAGELGFTDVITHWPRPRGPVCRRACACWSGSPRGLPRWR